MIANQIGHYKLISELGKGEQGVVYKVEWFNRKGEINDGALKILKDSDLKSILAEISNWAKVSQHENILTFKTAGEIENRIFIISELAPEGDLQNWIAQFGGKEEFFNEAVCIMLGMLDGLEHLHQNDIIHRDIKPANVFLKGKTPLLADFGLARNLEFNRSSNLGGTLAYMSPNLINVYMSLKVGERKKNKRTEFDDLWAIAGTFQEMLTGEMPFSHTDDIRDFTPKPITHNHLKRTKDFFSKAFARKESDRFQTANEMSFAINSILNAEKSLANSFSEKTTIPDNKFPNSDEKTKSNSNLLPKTTKPTATQPAVEKAVVDTFEDKYFKPFVVEKTSQKNLVPKLAIIVSSIIFGALGLTIILAIVITKIDWQQKSSQVNSNTENSNLGISNVNKTEASPEPEASPKVVETKTSPVQTKSPTVEQTTISTAKPTPTKNESPSKSPQPTQSSTLRPCTYEEIRNAGNKKLPYCK